MIFSDKTQVVFDHSGDTYDWRKSRMKLATCTGKQSWSQFRMNTAGQAFFPQGMISVKLSFHELLRVSHSAYSCLQCQQ